MPRYIEKLLLAGFLVVVSGLSLLAQQSSGTIKGTVKDPSSGVLVGAQVTARNDDTGVENVTLTNDSGVYSYPPFVIGRYTLTASLTGFKTAVVSGVRLISGQTMTVDLKLQIGEVQESVTVSAAPPTPSRTRPVSLERPRISVPCPWP